MIATLGAALLAVALLSGTAGAAVALAGRSRRVADALLVAHAASFGGALLLLTGAFLAGRLEIEYVWQHTRLASPWYYKLAGVWAGQKGSVLIWGALAALVAAIDGLAGRHPDPSRRVARVLLLALSTAFAGYLLADDMFRATRDLDLARAPAGRGLQEVLETVFMVVHPPVQFAAYAAIAVPAAYAIAGLLLGTPTEGWSARALAWARPAWLLTTLGLGLGGLWAYYVLSFGGYWAWDPVETANLLPWLALTAYLHAGTYAKRHGDFPLAAPALAIGALALVLFATFSTRSGLWVSVHAFTDPTDRFEPEAPARLLSILDVHAPTRFFLTLLLVTLLLAGAAVSRRVAAGRPAWRRVLAAHVATLALAAGWAAVDARGLVSAAYQAGAATPIGAGGGAALLAVLLLGAGLLVGFLVPATRGGDVPVLSERGLLHAGVAIFGLALAVTLVLDLMVVNGPNRAVFDARAPFVALPLVAVLTATMALRPLGARAAIALAAAPLALAALVALAATRVVLPASPVVLAAAPLLLAAAVALLARLARLAADADASPRARTAGALLVLAGVAGASFWSNPPDRILGLAAGLPAAAALIPASFGAILAGVLVLRGGGRAPAVAGATLGALGWGWGLGAALALAGVLLAPPGRRLLDARRPALLLAGSLAAAAALATGVALAAGAADLRGGWLLVPALLLALALAARFLSRGVTPAPAARPRLAHGLRQTAIALLHLGLIVGLAGYAASTYAAASASFDQVTPVAPGGEARVGDLTLRLGEPGGERGGGAREWYARVTIPFDVVEDGEVVDRGRLEFYHRAQPVNHYDPVLEIRRGAARDVYVSVLAFRVNGTWIAAHGEACYAPTTEGERAAGACFGSLDVDAVAFDASVLPLVTLVWAGLSLLCGAMLMLLAAEVLTRKPSASAPRPGVADGEVFTSPTQS